MLLHSAIKTPILLPTDQKGDRMPQFWETTFRDRMTRFERDHREGPDSISLSIKIRVTSGCFHREHSPYAYELIDEYLAQIPGSETDFALEEHESGPEVLVYVAAATAGITLSKSVIDLIVTILKARIESVHKGERPSAPVEVIVRRIARDGEFREETVLRFSPSDPVIRRELEAAITEAAKRLLDRHGHESS